MRSPSFLGGAALLAASIAGPAPGQAPAFGELHAMVPPDPDRAADVALGDVDGDGDLDVLVGNEGAPPRLLQNDGSGLLAVAPANVAAVAMDTTSVALGDVDGDGDLDAFVGNNNYLGNGAQDRLYLNDGAGAFSDVTATNLPVLLDKTRGVALGDVDGDGDLDAFVANDDWTGPPNRLYLNGGTGAFADASATNLPALSSQSNNTAAVALGDVDGDGDLDAFLGSVYEALLLNDGTGSFTDASGQVQPFGDYTRQAILADADGDGDLDAWTANLYTSNRIFLNGGAGTFTLLLGPSFPGGPSPFNGFALGVADLDGDGDLDVLTDSRLRRNDGAGIFTDVTATSLPSPTGGASAIALGDMDGDGDVDAFLGKATWYGTGPEDLLYLNDGAGVFADANPQVPRDPSRTAALAVGDVDGDGDPDALLMGLPFAGGIPSRVQLNDGAGGFTVAAAAFPAWAAPYPAVALGDVDADGDLDAITGNYDTLSGPDELFLNDGSGVFTSAPANVSSSGGTTTGLALGDVDGDGDLDVLAAKDGTYWGPGAVSRLYLNDGAGSFSSPLSQLPLVSLATKAVALGDVDGDGDLDAYLGNASVPGPSGAGLVQDRLYLNNGAGFFANGPANLPPDSVDAFAVVLGDLDGDGDLDAYVASGPAGWGPGAGTPQDRLYRNGGTGVFTDVTATDLPASSGITTSAASGDLDADGDLDLYLGKTEFVVSGLATNGLITPGAQDRLLLNDGAGLFADATAALPPHLDLTTAVAVADLDLDGDLDVLVGNEGRNRVLTNLTVQLGWRSVPRVGKPVRIEIHGPPSGIWFRGTSLATAAIPVPPLGFLRLHPASFIFLGSGPLDAEGRAVLTVPVPPDLALIGLTLYEQAAVGAPFRFTNLEVVTLTAF